MTIIPRPQNNNTIPHPQNKNIQLYENRKTTESNGTLLTPFQQALRYIGGLPLSQDPRWIITCNFAEFDVYDMENPNAVPQRILLKDLVYNNFSWPARPVIGSKKRHF